VNDLVDVLCIYALVAGMATSLGRRRFSTHQGAHLLAGVPTNRWAWSSSEVRSSGRSAHLHLRAQEGHPFPRQPERAVFSSWRPSSSSPARPGGVLNLGTRRSASPPDLFTRALFTGTAADDGWPKWWILFLLGGWLAWAPLVGLLSPDLLRAHGARLPPGDRGACPPLSGSGGWRSSGDGAPLGSSSTSASPTSGAPGARVRGLRRLLPAALSPGCSILRSSSSRAARLRDRSERDDQHPRGLSVRGINAREPRAARAMKLLVGFVVAAVAWDDELLAGVDGSDALVSAASHPALGALADGRLAEGRLSDPAPLRGPAIHDEAPSRKRPARTVEGAAAERLGEPHGATRSRRRPRWWCGIVQMMGETSPAESPIPSTSTSTSTGVLLVAHPSVDELLARRELQPLGEIRLVLVPPARAGSSAP